MKHFIISVITFSIMVVAPATMINAGTMESYCSAPPYVTRSIPPNIMILLDNSCDMLNSAYDHSVAYNPATKYTGYFISNAYYYGGSQNRFKVVKQNVTDTDYIKTNYNNGVESFDIVFMGNFLNYMSMSRYDLLQKILTGGSSAVPRMAGGAAVVRSMSGSACAGAATSWSWTDTTYAGCKFIVDAGEFRIEDESAGSCDLLTQLNIARAPRETFFASILRKLHLLGIYETVIARIRGTVRSFAKTLDKIDFPKKAYAAPVFNIAIDTTTPLPAGTKDLAYTQQIIATGSNGTPDYSFTFSISAGSLPPGLSLSATTCTTPSTDPGSCGVTLSGTPTTAGIYYFTVRVIALDSKSPTARSANITKDFSVTINAGLNYQIAITSSTLPSGLVSTSYSQSTPIPIPDTTTVTSTLKVTGLPQSDTVATLASVKVNVDHTYDGDLQLKLKSPSGTEIILSNQRGGSGDNFIDTVFSSTAVNSIAIGTAPFSGTFAPDQPFSNLTGGVNGTWTLTVADLVASDIGTLNNWSLAFNPSAKTYSQTLMASGTGGTEPYTFTWSICTDTALGCRTTALPPGLSLNTATGEIYGTPTTAGVYNFTVRVDVKDATNAAMGYKIKDMSITIGASSGKRTKAYQLWVDIGKDYYNASLPADLSIGLIQKYWERAKWGMTTFDQVGNQVKVKVNECIGSNNLSTFMNSLDSTVPSNVINAPLATAYYGLIKYFQNYGKNTDWQGGCIDPFTNDNIPCRKNFILTLSSAYDVTGSYFSQTCSGLDYGNSSAKLVQNACYGYHNDQRDDNPVRGESPKDGEQNLYHFAVYTFGKDNESAKNDNGTIGTDRLANKRVLEDAAEAGGPTKKFYDASQGSNLSLQLMRAIEDILSQAASGTAVSVLTTSSRGVGSMVQAYFLPSQLEETRDITWTGYLQNLWIDQWDNLREDSNNDLKLIPDTVNRSDGDKVVKLFFDTSTNETKAATFTTTDQGTGGTLGTCTPPEMDIKPFDQVNYLWEAGKKLALRSYSNREIYTSTKVIRNTSSGPVYPLNAGTPGNIFNHTGLGQLLNADQKAALNTPTATDPPEFTVNNIIDYVRGKCLESDYNAFTGECGPTVNPIFRDRRLKIYESGNSGTVIGNANGNVWKLGDIISSTPKVLATTAANTYYDDYDDETYFDFFSDDNYKRRSAVAFVGANDGMVHAFNVGYLKQENDNQGTLSSWVKALFKNTFSSSDSTNAEVGEEVWSFVPYNAFPYLKYLADPTYCHIYYNDLSLRIIDASLGCSSDSSCDDADEGRVKQSWRTLLVGGMRFGGSCEGTDANPAEPPDGSPANVGFSSYFAIDITDTQNPVPLWEFSDYDMGFATTFPSIIRTGEKSKNGNWYVAFGSGSKQLPKSGLAGQDIGRSSTGHVYILNLKTGELVKTIDLDHAGIVGDILAVDADKDYHSEKLYFGTAYKDTTWKGKIVSVSIANTALVSTSTFTTRYLFTGNYPFTASPDATKEDNETIWVYAGSGKYNYDEDENDLAQQIFVGMKDKIGVTYPVTTSNLVDKTLSELKGNVTATATVCTYDDSSNSFENKVIVTKIQRTSAAATVPDIGWYLKLVSAAPKSERVISRPLAIGGLVDFLTYMPSSTVCAYGGNSYLYSVGYKTGEATQGVSIRADKSTSGTSGNVTVNKRVLLGPGAPPTGEAIIIPPPKSDALKKKIQVATGVIVEAENAPEQSVISQIIHWLKK